MSTWILEGELAILLGFLLAPLLLPVYIAYEYRKSGAFHLRNAVFATVGILYAAAIPAFTLLPLPPADYCETNTSVSHAQLNPFNSFANIISEAGDVGVVGLLTSTVFLEVVFNVVFFIPLGLLVRYRWRWGFWRVVGLGFAVSLLIETTQGTGVFGLFECPYRLADVDDLITNTCGAALGWLLGGWLSGRLPEPAPEPTLDLDPPGEIRRSVAWLGDVVSLVVFGALLAIIGLLIANLIDPEATDREWFKWLETALGTFVPIIGLQLIVPLVRRDAATPGKITTWLAVADQSDGPASRRQTLIRFAVRWLPFMILIEISSAAAIIVLILGDLFVAWRRTDNRSLTGVLSDTRTVTRRSLP